MATVFDRLNERRPPAEKATRQPHKIQHAQRVLEWILRWNEPTIRARDIRLYGPRPRDRQNAIDAAKFLAEQGWLEPMRVRRYDSHMWRVVRKPIIDPQL